MNNQKSKYKRKVYWEALLIVVFNRFIGSPEYQYGWWVKRLRLISTGKI